MTKQWPFGFFVYTNSDPKDDETQTAPEAVESANPVEGEDAMPVEEQQPSSEEEIPETETLDEEIFDEEIFDEEGDEDLPDLEEELEIALEAAHQEEVAKQHRIFKGVTAGVAILGAIGLATGFTIHAHFKKNRA